jgi:hypothetical protein
MVQPVTKVQQKCGEGASLADLADVKMWVETAIYAENQRLAIGIWQLVQLSLAVAVNLNWVPEKEEIAQNHPPI